eukprot:m.1024048 g.1024048  ORF g.1024048 m.1024048 type:complete len:65 (+) comp24098_c0_seq68:295-489(+)
MLAQCKSMTDKRKNLHSSYHFQQILLARCAQRQIDVLLDLYNITQHIFGEDIHNTPTTHASNAD